MLGVGSGQGDLSGVAVEMMVDFPRMAIFKVKSQKRGLSISGRNGIPSRRMEDKQRSMRIDKMSAVSRQEHRSNLTLV